MRYTQVRVVVVVTIDTFQEEKSFSKSFEIYSTDIFLLLFFSHSNVTNGKGQTP